MNPSDSEQAQWFAKEVLPHEPALRAYLQSRFPSLPDKDDIVQEAYIRVIKAHATGGVRFAKSFLFTTARNAALDVFRRRNANPLEEITNFTESSVLEEQSNAADGFAQRQELEILADAVSDLPDRCREVMLLRYLESLSYKEIAARLEISAETVKVHITKGMRRCTEYFAERGLLKNAPKNDEGNP